jgi:hypothetical protein
MIPPPLLGLERTGAYCLPAATVAGKVNVTVSVKVPAGNEPSEIEVPARTSSVGTPELSTAFTGII